MWNGEKSAAENIHMEYSERLVEKIFCEMEMGRFVTCFWKINNLSDN